MYSDGEGNYGCSTCGRHWKASGVYPIRPIALKLCKKWSFWRRHWIEGKALDIEVHQYTTVIHLGFIRLILGRMIPDG